MGSQLPEWIQWVQAIAVVVIACVGAWIAYRQSEIASAKLNLDLFDKRYGVYTAIRDAVVHILKYADFSDKELREYNWGVIDAAFLFKDEIEAYTDALRKKIAQYMYVNGQVKHLAHEHPERPQFIDQEHALFAEFEEDLKGLKDRFKPYLNLRRI
jgi:hypothetical protein